MSRTSHVTLRIVPSSRGLRSVTGLAWAMAIAACSGRQAPAPAPATVTFNKDVAPIVFANCAPCHRPGEVAPFTLLGFADLVKHADGVAQATRKREMPPWLPERGDFPIVGERRLRDDQIDTIQRWVKGGMVEGNAADLPKAPSWPDGWQLGHPDSVLTVSRPYTLQPGGEDVYRNLVVNTRMPADVFVRAVEFKTNGAPIHHAVIRVDRSGAARRRDGEDGQPGFDGMAWQSSQDPDGHFIGWAPGRGPIVVPEGMPWRLDRGADLVVELHMLPPKSPHVVQPSIALYLASSPPVQTPLTVKMGSKLIDIPAGEPAHVIADSYQLPVTVDLMSVYPHAHYLARDMLVRRRFPTGRRRRCCTFRSGAFTGSRTTATPRRWRCPPARRSRCATPTTTPARTTTTRTCRRCESASARTRPTRWRSSDCRCCRSRWPTPRASCRRSPSAMRSPTWRSARCASRNRRATRSTRRSSAPATWTSIASPTRFRTWRPRSAWTSALPAPTTISERRS